MTHRSPKKKKESASDWANRYYAGQTFTQPKPTARAAQFAEWGLGPPANAKSGCPAGFPDIKPGKNNEWKNRSAWLAAAEKAYAKGYGDVLILAVKYNFIFCIDLALPDWVQSAFFRAFTLWLDHDAKSMEVALGIVRPRTKIAEHQFWADNLSQICIDVGKAISAGVRKSTNSYELFSKIGDHYGGKKGKTIRTHYEAARKLQRRYAPRVKKTKPHLPTK